VAGGRMRGFAFTLILALAATSHAAQPDHIMVGARSLDEGIAAFKHATGVTPAFGGKHPGRGTQNALVSLGHGTYLEIIAPSDEPSNDALVITLKKLDKLTPLHWAVRVDDAAATHAALRKNGFKVTDLRPGSRMTPAGDTLHWTTFDIENLNSDAMPFFIAWAKGTRHPSTTSPGGCTMKSFEVASPSAKELTRALKIAGYSTPVKASKIAKMTLSLDCGGHTVRFGD
jgi:hypothetical protein